MPDALGEALDRAVAMFEGYDNICRFRFAAKDMRLVASAATALVDAHEHDGNARLWERIIETGMVVTYARPFVEGNDAGLRKAKWRPQGDEARKLHDELIDLRNEYHAHAGHAPHRALEVHVFGDQARPVLTERWEFLPTWKLSEIKDIATGQAERFEAEADRLDLDLLGPRAPR